jgi:hypothetical protein
MQPWTDVNIVLIIHRLSTGYLFELFCYINSLNSQTLLPGNCHSYSQKDKRPKVVGEEADTKTCQAHIASQGLTDLAIKI